MHRLQTVLYWVAQISVVLAGAAAVVPKGIKWA
jgi:hypothetical protein